LFLHVVPVGQSLARSALQILVDLLGILGNVEEVLTGLSDVLIIAVIGEERHSGTQCLDEVLRDVLINRRKAPLVIAVFSDMLINCRRKVPLVNAVIGDEGDSGCLEEVFSDILINRREAPLIIAVIRDDGDSGTQCLDEVFSDVLINCRRETDVLEHRADIAVIGDEGNNAAVELIRLVVRYHEDRGRGFKTFLDNLRCLSDGVDGK